MILGMYKKSITKLSNIHFFLFSVAGILSVLIVAVIFLVVKTEDVPAKVSLAMAASSTIPYVTDTEGFIAYLRSALKESGAESIQSRLKTLYADSPVGEQHMSFHYLGEVLYEQSGAAALPLCEDWYGFGCYHGFLLVAIDREGYEVVPFLDKACLQRHGNTIESETCQHGIGHGLLEFSGRDPLKALEACNLVADVYPKLGCASGVFMEYFAPTQSDVRSKVSLLPVYDEHNPLNVCSSLAGRRQATCLFEIQSWWEDVGDLSPRTVEALCNSVEDTEAREFCLIGYGNLKGPYVAPALPYCDEFVVPESHALCRAGILWAAEHQEGSSEPESACSNLGDEYRSMCFEKGRFMCELEGGC